MSLWCFNFRQEIDASPSSVEYTSADKRVKANLPNQTVKSRGQERGKETGVSL